MDDDKNNEVVNENPPVNEEKGSSSSGASSFFASAWSAWGKVKPKIFHIMNIISTILYKEN